MEKFENIINKLSPTLRRITYKLNGHFTFFDEDDLFQEALEHLWLLYKEGGLGAYTDSYILQGCYFHLKNYIRTNMDKTKLSSIDAMTENDDPMLDRLAAVPSPDEAQTDSLAEEIRKRGLTEKEEAVLSMSLDGFTIRKIGEHLGISHVMVLKIKKRIRSRCGIIKKELKSGYHN